MFSIHFICNTIQNYRRTTTATTVAPKTIPVVKYCDCFYFPHVPLNRGSGSSFLLPGTALSTTIGWTQGVGAVTLLMGPFFSWNSSSSLSFWMSGTATGRDPRIETGVVSAFNLKWQGGPFIGRHTPSKMTWNLVIKFFRSAAFRSPVIPGSSAAAVLGTGVRRERRWGKVSDDTGLLSVSTSVMADEARVFNRAWGYDSGSMPSFCWDDLESTACLRSGRTQTVVVIGRLSSSSAFQLTIALKVPSFTIGDPVAVSGEAAGSSLTPLKVRRNVSRGMASNSTPVSGRKSTCAADDEDTCGETEMSTSSAAVTAPIVVECPLIERTSPDFFFFSFSQTDVKWLILL